MLWIATIFIIVVICIVIILFIHGATRGRPDWHQRELDDEQMKAVSRMKTKKTFLKMNVKKRMEQL